MHEGDVKTNWNLGMVCGKGKRRKRRNQLNKWLTGFYVLWDTKVGNGKLDLPIVYPVLGFP